MSFFKNVLNVFANKQEIKEPEIYKAFNEQSVLISQLTKLADSNDPSIDIKKVKNHLKLFSIGQTGEKSVLFELKHSMLPIVILHDVYIEYGDLSAQLDFVVITHQFVMIIEVKKLFGNIKVTDKGEFQRVITKNNKVVNKEGMYSPINQVERHVAILEKLLKETGKIENCPIHYAVTFANPKTILDVSKNAPPHIQSSVIRHDQIKTFLLNQLEKKPAVSMSDQQVYDIADTLIKRSTEKPFNRADYLTDTPAQNLTSSLPDKMNNTHDVNLKQKLVDFRLKRSRELNIKPYHVFTNKTLDLILEKQPVTIEDLLLIEGIGEKKAGEFGDEILAIIQPQLPEETQVHAPSPKRITNNNNIKSNLIEFRAIRSKELNMKPYYIFTNKTLDAIITEKPMTMKDLLKIEGIGQKKAEEFGEDILKIVKG
ncbi:HRDC domain-containing protein [Jeotgalibacillus salarius]|uniref:Helicase n=1 Tax=Jeotgalibacillus salarius TaxID=546023 RepID=A0A4Y8LPU8_9BACL|nr:HRDC domain-containing protein [Jeotgalibacillus salarius]TFE04031.1 helicase [Jeotgalibacillus salarius]